MSSAQGLSCCVEPGWISSLWKSCDPPECCCGCCSALRPRYKRLVDNIFPPNPQDGLVRSNMEKLTFYVLSSPEKLDRIGEYLAQKVARDINRHRNGYVLMSMEAMDQLLVACHAQCLNLFVESFLKVVQRLLEAHEPELQLLATQSFVKFANIEEDTPSYHRRYDFFVSKFSSLCHSSHDDQATRTKLRLAGLCGLQGVVRKTVSDDLQVNIMENVHMEKIVPSLLFNMQDQHMTSKQRSNRRSSSSGGHSQGEETTPLAPANSGGGAGEDDQAQPWILAENCLRELTGRATFGHIHSVLTPVLRHLDGHLLWVPNDFAVHTFKIIMYSIQAQYSSSIIQALMNHLDECSKETENAKVLTGMVNVLSHIVAIAASESIGPSVLDTFNSLLNHLRCSIETRRTTDSALRDEQQFQEAVINALGEFANNLPDYQKIEIMMFILNKVPPPIVDQHRTDALLQRMLLKSLLKVGTKYRTVQMAQAFPSSFLQPLLRMSLAPDPAVRLLVQQIFHTLLDRHGNLVLLERPPDLSSSKKLEEEEEWRHLSVEKGSRQDVMFMRKNGGDILQHIYENFLMPSNREEHYSALYTTLALLCVELGSEEALMELLRLTFALQDLAQHSPVAMSPSTGPSTGQIFQNFQNFPLQQLLAAHRAATHSLVASFLFLVGRLTAIPALCSHVDMVVKTRAEKAPYLLPGVRGGDGQEGATALPEASGPIDPLTLGEELLFDRMAVVEALRSTGHDTGKLMQPFVPKNNTAGEVTVTRSISDLNVINTEVDSVTSSPGITRRQPEEEITMESLKKLMLEPVTIRREEAAQRRLQVVQRFRTAPFQDLLAKQQQQEPSVDLQNRLNEIFGKLPSLDFNRMPMASSSPLSSAKEDHGNLSAAQPLLPPVYPIKFPDLFVF